MIFQHTFENVLNKNKTQTRRIIKSQEQAIRGRYNRIEAVQINGRSKWVVGKTYAVQTGRGEPSIARVQITRINSQKVKYISKRDAIAEGFKDRSDFLDTWKAIHGEDAMDVRVWILHFELVINHLENYPASELSGILQEAV